MKLYSNNCARKVLNTIELFAVIAILSVFNDRMSWNPNKNIYIFIILVKLHLHISRSYGKYGAMFTHYAQKYAAN